MGPVGLSRNFQMRRRKPQPLPPDIVDVGEDGSDGASFRTGEFCLPGAWIEMLEDELVHALVGGPNLERNFAEIRRHSDSAAGHEPPVPRLLNDPAATDHDVAIIENRCLSGRDGTL